MSSWVFRSQCLQFGFERVDAGSIGLDRLDQAIDYGVEIMISRIGVGTSKFSSSSANKIKIRFFQ